MAQIFWNETQSWTCSSCYEVIPPGIRHDCYSIREAERNDARSWSAAWKRAAKFNYHADIHGYLALAKQLDEANLLLRDCQERVDRYYARNAELREALEQVEWFTQVATWNPVCPWCNHPKRLGHAPNCIRQKALGLCAEKADQEHA